MAKTLPNINKPVPEATDPALIKPVSDAIEAVDQAIGAKPSTLTTTAKTIVPAVNELKDKVDTLEANTSLLEPLEVISTADVSTSSPVSFTAMSYRLYLATAGGGVGKGMWIISASATNARANEVIAPANVSISIDGLNVEFSSTTTVHLSIIRIR